jgi:hypothetical protein
MRPVLWGLVTAAFALSPVRADVLPPPPPPPAGPDEVVIRGVTLAQKYDRWRSWRWRTIITECEASQPGCKGKNLAGCFVTGSDAGPIEGGDLAGLMALDKAAEAGSIKLMLDHCELSEIELVR